MWQIGTWCCWYNTIAVAILLDKTKVAYDQLQVLTHIFTNITTIINPK